MPAASPIRSARSSGESEISPARGARQPERGQRLAQGASQEGQGREALPLPDGRPELARQESLLSLLASSPRLQRQCACGAPSAGGGSCAACEDKGRSPVHQSSQSRRATSEPRAVAVQAATKKSGPVAAIPTVEANPVLSTERKSIELTSSGLPLDSRTRRFMESRFGGIQLSSLTGGTQLGGETQVLKEQSLEVEADQAASRVMSTVDPSTSSSVDFSRVTIHSDSKSAAIVRSINARAFTMGTRIAIDPDQVNLSTTNGQWLLAHELAHTIQQSQIPSNYLDHPAQRQDRSVDLAGQISRTMRRARRWRQRAEDWLSDRADDVQDAGERALDHGQQLAEGMEHEWEAMQGEGSGSITEIQFDGSHVALHGSTSYSAAAISGLLPNHPTAAGINYTHPQYQHLANIGPIPEGSYFLEPSESESSPPGTFNTSAWGVHRTRLHEKLLTNLSRLTSTTRTGGFYLHQDANHNGTAGCIGIVSARDNAEIHRLIRANTARIPVVVSYPTPSATTGQQVRPEARTERPVQRQQSDEIQIPLLQSSGLVVQRQEQTQAAASPLQPSEHYLVQAGMEKLQQDLLLYSQGSFPENYYELISRFLFERALQQNGRNYALAFEVLDDLADGDLGFAFQRDYTRIVGTDSSNGWDKVRHFTYTALLQYRSGGFLAPELFTYGKEIFDGIESIFGADPEGYSIPDIRADNRGEAFAEEMRERELREHQARLPVLPPPVPLMHGLSAGGGLRGLMARDRQRTFGQEPILQRQEATGATVSEDHLDRFHGDPDAILNQINPYRYCRLNCPATADAFENFVRTGRIDAAHCDRDAELRGELGYSTTGRLSAPYTITLERGREGRGLEGFRRRVQRLLRAHGDVLVVEAERTQAQQNARPGHRLSQHHYFVIVRIRDVLFIVDAYRRQVDQFAGLTHYLNDINVSFLRYIRAEFSAVPQQHP